MKRQARRIIAATTLSLVTFAAFAHAAFEGIGDSDVRFQAVGPAGLKIDGEGAGLSVKESAGSLVMTAKLTGLKTGIDLRDKHLKKYLNVDKHPTAKLEVARSSLKLPDDKGTVEGTGTGKLTLNGQTKPVSYTYKAKRTGSDYHVQGMTDVDITKFGIEEPCYLGVCVDKDVKIKVKFKVRDK